MSIEVNATEQIIEVNATGSTIDINVSSQTVDVNATTSVIDVEVSNGAGPAGPGVPTGGTTGQVLKKLSNSDYDTYWALDGGGVPYSGATGDVDLGEYELKAGQIEFDQSPTGTAGVGVLRWNNTDGTLDLGLKGGSVTLQVGEDIVARVVNKTGSNLLASQYKVVKVSSAQGQRLAVNFAQANNDNNSADTIGLVIENINNNQEGWIQIMGQVTEINTTGSLQGETWADGDVLYLSPTTAGSITNVKPVAPQHLVVLGYVEYAHSQHGKIYVKVMNGWELGELHDVDTTGATDGQVLSYDGALGIWKPVTNAAGNIYTTDGTLAGNRIVSQSNKYLVFRTNQTNLSNYTYSVGVPTGTSGGTWPSSLICEGEYLMNSVSSAEPFNTRVWARNQTASTRNFYVNQVFADITSESTGATNIFNQTFYTRKGSQLDTSLGVGSMDGIRSIIGHYYAGSQATTEYIESSNIVNYKSSILNYVGYVTNAYGYYSDVLSSISTTTQDSIIDNYYAFYSTGTIGSSGPSGHIGNYYGLYLNGLTFNDNGSVEYYWGLYAPDNYMKHILNGDLVLGDTVTAGYKLDVNGTVRIQGRLSTTSSNDNFGPIGTDFIERYSNNFIFYTNGVSQGAIGSAVGTGFRSLVLSGVTANWTTDAVYIGTSTAQLSTYYQNTYMKIGGVPTTYTATAILELESTNRGFLRPRLTTTQRNAIVSPATGLSIYNTTTNTNDYYNGTSWVSTQAALTRGNLTETGSSILTISGGTNAVIGSGTTIQVAQASGSTNGFLSSTDWTTFNNKQNALTNPITGTGTSGQVAYWSGTNTQTGSATFTFSPTAQLLLNNSVTAATAIARGANFTPTLVAAANNDVLVGLDVNPTFTNGAFTGVRNAGLRVPALGASQASILGTSGDIVISGSTNTSRLFLSGGGWQTNATTEGTAYIRLDGTPSGAFEFGFGSTSTLTLYSVASQTYTSRLRIYGSTGNMFIGPSPTDGGQRLQVNGDAFIKGSGNTSATTAFTVQNSDGTNLFRITNQGVTSVEGTGSLRVTNVLATNGQSLLLETGISSGVIRLKTFANASSYVHINNPDGAFTSTSGDIQSLVINQGFAPTSGTATMTYQRIQPTINQTGGANGITRGLYINPTLTAVIDWRSIEWSNNAGWGLYGAGTSNNYLAGKLLLNTTSLTNTEQLTVGGNILLRPTGGAGVFAETSIRFFAASDSGSGASIFTTDNSGYGIGLGISTRDGGTVSEKLRIFRNGNVIIQSGGTFTDAGFRLDVNGTARVQNQLTISNSSASSSINVVSSVSSIILFGNASGSNTAAIELQSTNTRRFRILATNVGTTFESSNQTGTFIFNNTITLDDAKDLAFGTTTGTKIGTATSQKIGFWNTTPIVQPTTAVASATFTANTGTAVNDASTFDGYTMAQVVKALRNAGLLA